MAKKHHDKHHAYHEGHKHHSGGKHTAHRDEGKAGHGKKEAGSAHTGKIRHEDMTSLMDGVGAANPMAHASHHEANDAYDMPHGMSPKGDESEEHGHGHGGEGMAGNADYC